jgi:PEP-CTERM motif
MNLKPILVLIALFIATVSRTHADVVYDAFGPGNTYDTSAGQSVTGPTSGFPNQMTQALRFNTGSFSGTLSSIQIPLQSFSFGPTASNMTVSLFSNTGSQPNSIIESLSTITVPQNSNQVYTSNASGSTVLTASTDYWIVVGGLTDTWGGWQNRSVGIFNGSMASQTNGGAWGNFSTGRVMAARVNGVNAAPEPGSLALLSLGALGSLGIAIRRRRK